MSGGGGDAVWPRMCLRQPYGDVSVKGDTVRRQRGGTLATICPRWSRCRIGHTLRIWLCRRNNTAVSAFLILLAVVVLLSGCDWPWVSHGPDWTQRRLILIPGVCMSTVHLPPPPVLPPGLPQLPSSPRLPDWLTCGTGNQPVDAGSRARATFGRLIAMLDTAANGPQLFRSADLRFFRYDASSATTYTAASTRQSLTQSAMALEHEFRAWRAQEPRATFDIVGHSLGGDIALLWAARYATADDLLYVHAIATLDAPVAGYPQPLFGYLEPYLMPLLGDVARALSVDAPEMRSIAKAPSIWIHGPANALNAVYDVGNLRDAVVPAFITTLAGADGIVDDFGTGPDTFNHGAVLFDARPLDAVAAVLKGAGGPELNQQR